MGLILLWEGGGRWEGLHPCYTEIIPIRKEKDEPIVIRASAINKCQVANTRKVFRMVLEDYMNKGKDGFKGLKA